MISEFSFKKLNKQIWQLAEVVEIKTGLCNVNFAMPIRQVCRHIKRAVLCMSPKLGTKAMPETDI